VEEAPPFGAFSEGLDRDVPAASDVDDVETRAPQIRLSLRWLTVIVVGLALAPFAAGALALIRNADSLRDVFGDRAVITFTAGNAWKAPVLLGPYSRFYWHHPGPIYFYILSFWSGVFGGQVFGLALGATMINLSSAAGILVVARRRGGRPLLLWAAVSLVFYLVAIDPVVFDFWNPSVTLLPFALTLLLAWSVACLDWWAAPWLALSSTFVVQTHVGLVPGVVIAGGVAVLVAIQRARRRGALVGGHEQTAIRRVVRITALLTIVLWLPPIVQELTSPDGNLSALVRFFSKSGASHTLSDALLRTSLDSTLIARAIFEPVTLRDDAHQGLVLGIVLTVVALGVGLLAARRSRDTDATVLLAIVGLELVGAIYSVTRIVGAIEFYLVQWITAVGFVLWFAAGNAAIRWVRTRDRSPLRWTSGALGALGAVALMAIAAVGAVRASTPDVKEANGLLSLHANEVLFGRAPVRQLLAVTHRSDRVVLRLDSESAWMILAGDALQLRDHGRHVEVVDSPATRLLFDETMLVPRSTEGVTLAFSERPAPGKEPLDRGDPVVARQSRWRIVVVARN
jgi:hypothetical protein